MVEPLAKKRLSDLIAFAQESARLRFDPVTDVTTHKKLFLEFEHTILGLPGVHLDVSNESQEDVWLIVERLHESPAPLPESVLLKTWLELTNNPNKEPNLRTHVATHNLVGIGALPVSKDRVDSNVDELVALKSFPERELVENLFRSYLENIWKKWAAGERPRRQTISLYAKLFTIKQQFEGAIIDAQLELVWGTGLVIWIMDSIPVRYPIITQLVELSLNEKTMAIEVRPRDFDPVVELDIYSVSGNPGISDLQNISKRFFEDATRTFSPFDRSTFEPLLRSTVTHLDPKGVYWPTETNAEDRSLPSAGSELKMTDTWVFFARPRNSNLFVQDLDRFRKNLESTDDIIDLPGAVAALVTPPSDKCMEIDLPVFRGVSFSCNSGLEVNGEPAQDLFFPMPFNDEQVRIIQLLECFDGVVVLGPPGTGKTHTIANVICHYLALGKRVLVTSMKDPALAVLRDKLPEEIGQLTISLLTNEKDGMKQFEFAISKIASELQRIDRGHLSQVISHLEKTIDSYHAKIARIDRSIYELAVRNLTAIDLDGETLEPLEAVKQILEDDSCNWLEDLITISREFAPRFQDEHIIRLRAARRELGENLDYLESRVPSIDSFPDSQDLLRAHQDLRRISELQAKIDSGEIPPLVHSSQIIYESAHKVVEQISNIRLVKQKAAEVDWTASALESLRRGMPTEILELFRSLGEEIESAVSDHRRYLGRPVHIPDDSVFEPYLTQALKNLAEDKAPFGLAGLFGKKNEKSILRAIRVLGSEPAGPDDWKYVLDFLIECKHLKELVIRWNTVACEIGVPQFPIGSSHAASAARSFGLFRELQTCVKLESEIIMEIKTILPSWTRIELVHKMDGVWEEVEGILYQHLTRNRLAESWALKERCQKVMAGCDGRISVEINKFLGSALGNPEISDVSLQNAWSSLMEELRGVHDLKFNLDEIKHLTKLIEDSGAPKWAKRLRTEPATSTVDKLIPDNYRKMWRVKRLSTYFNTIDTRVELKRLLQDRTEMEGNLARTYQEIITRHTWLKIAENATPSVKSALMAYLSAISKIGKGGGKRAIRYRHDARQAAEKANPAIPCWIMPHYRISESLPAEFGCFDLVIVDEASQSDLSALPAILRAEKLLIVGDDKQVSPEGIGFQEEKIKNAMSRLLSDQVDAFRAQMSPDRSIYDLFKVVFADSAVMLKEHFRCVAPIIEYSKREFYNHELRPLRLPKRSERLDPPLIDVLVEDGVRKGDINLPEAHFICQEIKRITADPSMAKRSIGVVSLLGPKQALTIWKMLQEEVGLDLISNHRITCGDARTFQGKERDIMFLSMVVSPGQAMAISRDTFAQRFNVAASRARDRMYLVRSISSDQLSQADRLRKSLLAHFASPFGKDEAKVLELKSLCESPFEREIYGILTDRGYRVTPQVSVGEFRIDMVVEGREDNRLAIECDGDRYHGPDKWEDDTRRQRILERAGWYFWRCFASTFVLHREEMIQDLLQTLTERGIEPIGEENAGRSLHVEQWHYAAFSTEDDTENSEAN